MSDPCDNTHIEPSLAHDIRQVCLTTSKMQFNSASSHFREIRCDNGFDVLREPKNLICTRRPYILLGLCLLLIFRCPQLHVVDADRTFSLSYILSDDMLLESIIIMTLLFQYSGISQLVFRLPQCAMCLFMYYLALVLYYGPRDLGTWYK